MHVLLTRNPELVLLIRGREEYVTDSMLQGSCIQDPAEIKFPLQLLTLSFPVALPSTIVFLRQLIAIFLPAPLQ